MTTPAERQRRYRERHPDRVRAAARAYAAKRYAEPRVLSDHLCECGCGQCTYFAIDTATRRNSMRGEPLRFRHGHNKTGGGAWKRTRYLEEDRGYLTPCWVWQLKISALGYGIERDKPAHRNYYEYFKGAIPDGYQVDHLCHQRDCVNPDHLQAVTPGENLWRMFMGKAGLTPQQITGLRQWMEDNLAADQITNVWRSYGSS